MITHKLKQYVGAGTRPVFYVDNQRVSRDYYEFLLDVATNKPRFQTTTHYSDGYGDRTSRQAIIRI